LFYLTTLIAVLHKLGPAIAVATQPCEFSLQTKAGQSISAGVHRLQSGLLGSSISLPCSQVRQAADVFDAVPVRVHCQLPRPEHHDRVVPLCRCRLQLLRRHCLEAHLQVSSAGLGLN